LSVLGAMLIAGALMAAPAPVSPAPPTPAPFGTDEAIGFLRERWTGDLDAMRKRAVPVIRVLTTYSKTGYFLDGIEPKGVNADAFREFETWINVRERTTSANRIHVVLIPVSRDELIPALREGRGDLASANLTITPERHKLVDFSIPAYYDVSEIAVTGKHGPAPDRPENLSGLEVHVRASSSYFESLKLLNERLVQSGRPPVRIVAADELLETEDLLEMVNADLIPITIADSHLATFWSNVLPDLHLHPGAAIRSGGQIGVALRKGSPKLKAAIDDFVRTHRGGTLYGNALLHKYLQKTNFVRNAASGKEMKKFEQTIALFRKYGGQYGFDSLMVAAQGYQESRLDQSKMSPRGAVGVMQILPDTGRDMGVDDINDLDGNIRAGVRYLRKIYDTQFAGAPMSEVDKGLFCFAAYNAGPRRVAQLREKAKEMGLDPNKWFRNVEIAAARVIGRETVQYVANIYKYYVSYRLVLEQQGRKNRKAAGSM
jgi:membrane-bound lytic murein transglycosylase MltF